MKTRTLFSMLTFLLLLAATSFAQTPLSGSLEGFLDADTYVVEGDISIAEEDSLIIMPGSVLLFNEGLQFGIDGYLFAHGLVDDSIRFELNEGANGWLGIKFTRHASDSCRMDYCYISGSTNRGIETTLCSPLLNYCTLTGNSGDYGAGIFLDGSEAIIRYCLIENNMAEYGGGIYCSDSSPEIRNCVFRGNQADSGGGTAFIFESHPILEECEFYSNTATGAGGGVYSGGSDPILDHCIIAENEAENGGGIYFGSSDPSVFQCTISGNIATEEGGGINCSHSTPRIIDTIVEGNTGSGIYFVSSHSSVIRYNDFANNGDNDFTGEVPDQLGVINGDNNNGDPCDQFNNIFLDPVFVDADNQDFNLQETSPCINAGDPMASPDQDGTIADIGALFFYINGVDDNSNPNTIPVNFRIVNVYPNPFNSTVNLVATLPVRGILEAEIFDITGRIVDKLYLGEQAAGYHRFSWNAKGPSGTYFLRLSTDKGLSASTRLLYLK